MQRPLVIMSLFILAHGSWPWESHTMVVVAVQGASLFKFFFSKVQYAKEVWRPGPRAPQLGGMY